jgi:hypothetical protein
MLKTETRKEGGGLLGYAGEGEGQRRQQEEVERRLTSRPGMTGGETTAMSRRTILKARTKTKATAEHIKDGSLDVVSIGDLRVIITKDASWWLAQGLEIDYAAQGRSLNEAKGNFEHGLALLIDSHLAKFENIRGMLKPAPGETWNDLLNVTLEGMFGYSQVSIHDFPKLDELPFENIRYFEQQEAA